MAKHDDKDSKEYNCWAKLSDYFTSDNVLQNLLNGCKSEQCISDITMSTIIVQNNNCQTQCSHKWHSKDLVKEECSDLKVQQSKNRGSPFLLSKGHSSCNNYTYLDLGGGDGEPPIDQCSDSEQSPSDEGIGDRKSPSDKGDGNEKCPIYESDSDEEPPTDKGGGDEEPPTDKGGGDGEPPTDQGSCDRESLTVQGGYDGEPLTDQTSGDREPPTDKSGYDRVPLTNQSSGDGEPPTDKGSDDGEPPTDKSGGDGKPPTDKSSGGELPIDQGGGDGKTPISKSGGDGKPPTDQGRGDGEPPIDQGSGDGEPPTDKGSGDGGPPIDIGGGDGEPPTDKGGGDGEPSTDQGSGDGESLTDQGSGDGEPPIDIVGGDGEPPTDKGGSDGEPSTDQGSGDGESLADQGSGDGEPPIDKGGGDGEPPIDKGGGDGKPPIDKGGGDGESPTDKGGGDGEPPTDKGGGDGEPSTDQGSGDGESLADQGSGDGEPPIDKGGGDGESLADQGGGDGEPPIDKGRGDPIDKGGGDGEPSTDQGSGDGEPLADQGGGDGEPPTDKGGDDGESPIDKGSGDEEPLADQGSGDGEPPIDKGGGDGEPPTDKDGDDGEPPIDKGSGDGEPPTDEGGGDGEPPIDKGGGGREPPIDKGSGDGEPPRDKRSGDGDLLIVNGGEPFTYNGGGDGESSTDKGGGHGDPFTDKGGGDREPPMDKGGGDGEPPTVKSNTNSNMKNKNGQTPLELTSDPEMIRELIRHGANPTNVYETHGKVVVTKQPLQPPVKVFVVENPSAGKSTLTAALKSPLARTFTPAKKVSGVDEKTAGVIPHDFERKKSGPITLYDFAGQPEFYSSHAALLQNAIQISPPIFLLVVDLCESDKKMKQTIVYWLSFLENQFTSVSSKPHVIIVGSHVDVLRARGEDPKQKSSVVESLHKSHQFSNLDLSGFIVLDCQYPESTGMSELRKRLKKSCDNLRKHEAINFISHSFLVYLLDKFRDTTAFTINELHVALREMTRVVQLTDKDFFCFLPTHPSLFSTLCDELNDKGHILFLKDPVRIENSWVIIDKAALLSEVTGTIFAPETFKQHCKLASSTGVVPVSNLAKMFPKHDLEMLVGFLTHLEFCHKITYQEVLQLASEQHQTISEEANDPYLLFPALIQLNAPCTGSCDPSELKIWKPYSAFSHFGWILKCSHSEQFFTSRFLQVLLLRLAFSFAFPHKEDSANKEQVLPALLRKCSLWKNGIYWGNRDGVETLVEVVQQNKAVIVLMRCPEQTSEYLQLRSSIIQKVLATASEFCGKVDTMESFIDPSEIIKYPFKRSSLLTLFSLTEIAEAVVNVKTVWTTGQVFVLNNDNGGGDGEPPTDNCGGDGKPPTDNGGGDGEPPTDKGGGDGESPTDKGGGDGEPPTDKGGGDGESPTDKGGGDGEPPTDKGGGDGEPPTDKCGATRVSSMDKRGGDRSICLGLSLHNNYLNQIDCDRILQQDYRGVPSDLLFQESGNGLHHQTIPLVKEVDNSFMSDLLSNRTPSTDCMYKLDFCCGEAAINCISVLSSGHSTIYKGIQNPDVRGDAQSRPIQTRSASATNHVTTAKDDSLSVLVISKNVSVSTVYRSRFCCLKHASDHMPPIRHTPNVSDSNQTCSSTLVDDHDPRKPTAKENHRSSSSSNLNLANPSISLVRDHSSSQVRLVVSSDHDQEMLDTITLLLHAQHYEEIVQILNEIQSDSIPLCFVRGLAYLKLGNQNSAKTNFQRCAALAQNENSHGDIALCNTYLGDIEFTAQAYLNAGQYYRKAITRYSTECVATQFKMVPPSLSLLYSKLGSSLRSASKSVQAVQEYQNAIIEAQTDKDRLAAHTSLGNLYQSLGDNSAALKEYEQSVILAESISDFISLGWAHGNMGNAYLGLYQKDKALYHLTKSLDLAVEHEPIPQAIGRTYNNLGTAYQSLNDLDKAQEYYDLALSQAIYGSDIPGQARVYGNIGNVLMLKKDFERAIPHFTEVLQLSRDRSTISTAHHNRGCAYYEWAENKMETLYPEHSVQFHLHGPNVADVYERNRPLIVPDSIIKYYFSGSEDLEEVVKYHEESLDSIKGSPKGLTLSVSLFESNSRTFHRLQDCLVMQGKWDRALLVAEQSRARTLGELMLKKKASEYTQPLTSPLGFEDMASIASLQNCPLVYLSYTGARLLGWVIVPHSGDVSMNMFEVPVEDTMFDGKSFDYHVRYNLTETLVERSFEMYRSVEYDEESSGPVHNLHDIIGKPILEVLNNFPSTSNQPEKIVIIPDSYTSLVPFSCLRDPDSGNFLGDKYYFQMMPSLLSMGVLTQLPEVTVTIPADPHNFCVVGNPYIPRFVYDGQTWDLGKLPYAQREAEWVAHVLKTSPIVKQQATKSAVLMRIMSAQVIHLATHGSASAGFLAFASMTHCREGSGSSHDQAINSAAVLLNPEDVEKLNLSPALVVLSSCDSGRGTVKADGIQGMARAFILAGAQSVLTTLWRVPDESASVFMKFFYQYLMDGLKSSFALQKAILSLRCFSKYSQYVHWSGYQLTGRDIRFETSNTLNDQILQDTLGHKCVFPRLKSVKALQDALVNNPRLPTDVQVVRGSPGIRPSEVVKDFIHSSHETFKGGIFWINCRQPDFVTASIECIEKTIGTDLERIVTGELQQVMVVLDAVTELPTSEKLLKFMKNRFVHMVFIYKSYKQPDKLIKEVDKNLIRGCNLHDIEPLSMIDSTQRIVHSLLKEYHLAPNNEDQATFEKLAEFTSGSPVLCEITSKVLLSYFKENDGSQEALKKFSSAVALDLNRKERHTPQLSRKVAAPVRCMSPFVERELPTVSNVSEEFRDIWETNTQYDSWDSIEELLDSCGLSHEEQLLLNCLSIFSCSPIPSSLVTELSTVIANAAQKPHLAGVLSIKLQKMNLMRKYPSPVVLHPSLKHDTKRLDFDFEYVPQYISRSIWKSMEDIDCIIAFTTMYHALSAIRLVAKPLNGLFLKGLCYLLLEQFEVHFGLLSEECYQSACHLCLQYSTNSPLLPFHLPKAVTGEVELKDLKKIKEHIPQASTQWETVGVKLGVDIADIKRKNSRRAEDCFTAMLTRWLKMVHPKPNLKCLIEVLKSPAVGLPDAAKKLQDYCDGTCECFVARNI